MEPPPDMEKAEGEEAPLVSEHGGEAFKEEEFKKKYADWKVSKDFYPWTTDGEGSGARDENFFSSVSYFCCPKLTWVQFISIITALEFVVFAITLCIGGIDNS